MDSVHAAAILKNGGVFVLAAPVPLLRVALISRYPPVTPEEQFQLTEQKLAGRLTAKHGLGAEKRQDFREWNRGVRPLLHIVAGAPIA